MAIAGPLAEIIVGKGPEPGDGEDDADRWLHWFMRKMLIASIFPLPFIPGAVESWVLGKKMSSRANPALAAGEKLWRGIERSVGDDPDYDKAIEEVTRGLFMFTGVATRPLRAAGYLKDLNEGDVDARGIGDVVGGVLYGQRDDQPASLPTLVQDLAE
jgi:hypothetical protein